MQAAVGGGQTNDLSARFKGRSAIKTCETKDASQFVVAVVDGGFIETSSDLAKGSVTAAGPRTTCQFDVVVDGRGSRIVWVAQPGFTVVVAPANP